MKFIFIIPTYNRPDNLSRCLDSLFSLHYKNWQAIIINDGSSTDYTSVESQLECDQIHYLKLDENKGVNFIRNKALFLATEIDGDYVCFIDDDEFFTPEALTIAKKILEEQTINWLVLQCFLNDQQKTHMSYEGEMDYINDYLYGKNLKKDATHFIQKELAVAQKFTLFIRNGEEWTYFAALSKQTKMWVKKIPVKYNYHQEGGLFLGTMNKKSNIRPYLMKLYRPFYALSIRPTNVKAFNALLLQLLKLPFRLPQIGYQILTK